MKIAGYQLYVPEISSKFDKERHTNDICKNIENYHNEVAGFDLVVLPELQNFDYSENNFKILNDLSESLYGDSFNKFSNLARKLNCYITYGIPLNEDNKRYIAHVVISNSGEYIKHYKKIHISSSDSSPEKGYFDLGDSICTFKIDEWTFGILICYDFRFPELASEIRSRNNVDFIINPVALYKGEGFNSWPHFVITRALENQIYWLSINRSGENCGESIYCPPCIDESNEVFKYSNLSELFVFEPSKDKINEARRKNTFNSDRLEDYKKLKD